MCTGSKALGFLFFVILFSCASVRTIAQTNTEANRLLQEGIKLTEAGQLPQAVSTLQQAIKLDPHYADAYAALGRAYFKMREWRSAVDHLHRAAALNARQKTASTKTPEPIPQKSPDPIPQKSPDPIPTPTPAPTPAPTPVPISIPVPNFTVKVSQQTPPAIALNEDEQEPIGVTVAMNAPPPPPVAKVESKPVTPIPLDPPNEDVSLTKIYRVGPGDVLDIRTNEAHAEQSTLFTVTPAGVLEHPLLAEPLNVSTLTTEEIQTKIQEDLKKRASSEDPVVTVGVRDYASHTILVSGLVKDSGTKILRREAIPLYVVVADAQPLPEAARVTVVRNEKGQMFEVDLTDAAEMNLLVRPGDVINLLANETQFIYVGGEVKAPGEKIFRRGLTLTQAIISAGGVTPKSKVAEIGRDDGQGFLVKTSFKLKDIQTGKAMDPLLQPGDRIMVLR
jgi:protein involved in polysaccharide export with SLBB domain